MASNSAKYVICVKNDGYRASLVIRKVYRVLPDRAAKEQGLLRVIDESDEDYLFPEELFITVSVRETAKTKLSKLAGFRLRLSTSGKFKVSKTGKRATSSSH